MPELPMEVKLTLAGVISVAVNAFVVIYGQRISRLTTIDTSKIDDSAKFRHDLMTQLEAAFEELGLKNARLSAVEKENTALGRIVMSVQYELRIIKDCVGELENRDDLSEQERTRIRKIVIKSVRRLDDIIDETSAFSVKRLLENSGREKFDDSSRATKE